MMGFSAFAQTAVREDVTFKGKADADCFPRTGNYHYPATEAKVSIENGSITKIVNPAADRARAEMQQTNGRISPLPVPAVNEKGLQDIQG